VTKVFISPEKLRSVDASGLTCDFPYSVEFLLALKDEGAPIDGIIYLRPDFKNYNWNIYQEPMGGFHVQWREK